jgi:predicted transcriptional regulator
LPIRRTIYIYIERQVIMTTEEIERAYEAIKQHVRKHVTGDADDLFCACCNAFDRLKDGYNEGDGSVEDFAQMVAKSCLYVERNKLARRKFCRGKGSPTFYKKWD